MNVEELITCKKRITRRKRPQFKEDNRHYRMDIDLACEMPNVRMSMFLRKLVDFPEDFSIGLKLIGPNVFKEQDIVLVRFQGPHGGQSAKKSLEDLHNAYHVHEYTQDDLNCRRRKPSFKEDGHFSSFEEAIILFMEHCNIEDQYGIFNEEKEKINQIMMDLDI